jgi:hypothetical protein
MDYFRDPYAIYNVNLGDTKVISLVQEKIKTQRDKNQNDEVNSAKQKEMYEQYRLACLHFGLLEADLSIFDNIEQASWSFKSRDKVEKALAEKTPETVSIVVDVTDGAPDEGWVYIVAAKGNNIGFR